MDPPRMADNPAASDAMDDQLRGRVNEAWERYMQDRTEENHAAFERAVRVFAGWVLRGKAAGHGTASNK